MISSIQQFVMLLILFTIVLPVISYVTTITSNYSPPPAPTPTTPITRSSPYIQIGMITLIEPSNPFTILTYQREVNFVFTSPFSVTPSVAISIQSFVDSMVRQGFSLFIGVPGSDSTKAIIRIFDGSASPVWSVNVLMRTRIFACDYTFTSANIKIDYKEFGISQISTTQINTSPLAWTPSRVLHKMGFLNRFIFSLEATSSYSVIINFNQNQPSSIVQLIVQTDFPVPFSLYKTIGCFVILYLDDPSWQATFGTIHLGSMNKLQITFQSNIFYMIGLSSFDFKNGNGFNVEFNSDSTQILRPQTFSVDYQVAYQYAIINDTDFTPPPPIPITPGSSPSMTYNFNLDRIVSFSEINTTFKLIYKDVPLSLIKQKSQIQINLSNIWVESIFYQNGQLSIICGYNVQIENSTMNIVLKWVDSNIFEFKAQTNVLLNSNPSLKVYSIISTSNTLKKICQALQYLYLIGFILSLLSNKLIGLQLITFIQLGFFCLIPLNLQNIMFNSLKVMTSVNGVNLSFDNLLNVEIPSNYSSLKIQSNFLSNVNIMLIIIVLFPIIGCVLIFLSNKTKSFKYKPRLKMYGISCFYEWLFTVICFTLYNINMSLFVDITYLADEDKTSLAIGIISSSLAIGICVIYIIFPNKYIQFSLQLDKIVKFKCIPEKVNEKIIQIYPVLLVLQVFIYSFILVSQDLQIFSFVIILCLSLLITLYAFLFRPYIQKINKIRFMIHRCLLTCLIISFMICKSLVYDTLKLDNPNFNLVWIIIVVMFLDWFINFPFIVWKLFVWYSSPGIIDVKLMEQQNNQNNQNNNPYDQKADPVYYPILEYSKANKNQSKKKKTQSPFIKKQTMEQNFNTQDQIQQK